MTDTPDTGAPDMQESAAPRPLDLRVARVVQAREHPNADRLVVLDIDLGDEQRQIVAGIAEHYELEELDGRHIVVVANLAAARLRGEISQGMLLAAQREGELGLLLADAEPGTRLTTSDTPAGPAATITIDEFADHELRASADGVTVDGAPLEGAPLRVDREVYGTLR